MGAAAGPVGWHVVVPVKHLHLAKSRLGLPADVQRNLALALAADTVRAALAAPGVRSVLVVTTDHDVAAATTALGAGVVPDVPATRGAGLNAALGAGAAAVAAPGAGVAALVGDLPSLRPDHLAAALAAAGGRGRSFVPDRLGTGTVLLCAAPSEPLRPAFGPGSRQAHRASGARELAGPWPSLRRDVDTLPDLLLAAAAGVGPATAALLRSAGEEVLGPVPPARRTVQGTGWGWSPGGGCRVTLDDGATVVVPPSALARGGLRRVRSGQRVAMLLGPTGAVHVAGLLTVGDDQE